MDIGLHILIPSHDSASYRNQIALHPVLVRKDKIILSRIAEVSACGHEDGIALQMICIVRQEYGQRLFPQVLSEHLLKDRLKIADCGDVVYPSGDSGAMVKALEDHADKVLSAGKTMLTFGGDHYVTLPLLRACARHFGPLALIHFDAHSDTYAEGAQYDHGTMFRRAPDEGIVKPEKSIQIGIRTEYHDEDGYEVIDGGRANDLSADEIAAKIKKRTAGMPCYLTFDIDCLDPAYAPGTGTPVPGGISTDKALKIIRALKDIMIISADIVEVSPPYDVSGITALAAAAIGLDLLYLWGEKKGV